MKSWSDKAELAEKIVVWTWMATLIPLFIAGFWWHFLWAVIGLGLFVCWAVCTMVVYDPRWDGRK